jgi:hypothetical protein
MSPATLSIVEWYAAGAAAVAALLVSLDPGAAGDGRGLHHLRDQLDRVHHYGLLDPQPEEAIATLNFGCWRSTSSACGNIC